MHGTKIRRVTEHKVKTVDNEFLQVVTIWEQGMTKEKIKKELPYSKKHHVLVYDNFKQTYDFKKAYKIPILTLSSKHQKIQEK